MEASLRWYFSEPVFEGRIPATPRLLEEAVTQSLLAAARKDLRYEDGKPPRWVTEWLRQHPGDKARVDALIAREPRPLKKIPKGQDA